MSNTSTKRYALLIVLAWVLPPAGHARAWIDTGHKIIAFITWDELTPATKAKVIEILKQHPRYEQDLLAGLPEGSGDADAARHAYTVAATWPDLVRSQSHPMHFVANHPNWHYIDIPYAIEGQSVPATQPADKSADGPAPRNILEALTKAVADVKNPALENPDKAVALCWLLHLAGDIHQPLHTCTLYSPQFPTGDQGGNAQVVLRDPPFQNSQMNLHLLWDSLPGTFKSDAADGYVAAGLRADPRFSRDRLKDLLAVKDFAAWARESHDLAVEHVYLKGTLKGVAVHSRTEPKAPIPGVPAGYIERAEQIALGRVILASYRTADLLNSLFDPR